MKDPTDNVSAIEIMPKMKICERKKNSLIVYDILNFLMLSVFLNLFTFQFHLIHIIKKHLKKKKNKTKVKQHLLLINI